MGGPFSGPAGPRHAVRAVLGNADHCLVNLELPLTESTAQADKLICLKAPPLLAAELRDFGVDVATFANNHSLDFGVTGLCDTLDALDKARIAHVGAGMTLAESLKPAILMTSKARVAFLGIATTLPNGSGAGLNRPGVAPIRVITRYVIDPVTIDETPGMSPFAETVVVEGDRDRALNAVRAAAAESDLVIVAIHWGVPYGFVALFQDELADYQRPLGKSLIDAGASAVIGHHPHYLQGVEFHKGRPILYSLGNFIIQDLIPNTSVARPYPPYTFGSIKSDLTRLGAIVRLTWPDLAAGPECVLIPIALNAHGEPEIADREIAERAYALIARSSCKLACDAKLRFAGALPEITLIGR